ncbi:PP2C family protein-serine/threonine phosphatase [Deferribacter autotrophicus]|uniref:PP2C family protein-serine/threonine phosphatase n=1 Tax=Deferribacter autotrophicus TaxID=500465 RepID=A0A5A8F3N7_9BACT|nr:SpoIIE family protein phosphatase [Deferribacter autotrophicus]KAA0257104.1 PP2C family protein-serine/threonine phosphatase [Deferribacter autotrophicus]
MKGFDFSALLDSVDEIVMVIDENYSIQFVNNKLKLLTNKTPSQVTGKKCYSVLFKRTEPCENCPLSYLKEKCFAKDIIHDTIDFRGFRKIFRGKFECVGDRYFVEVFDDITEGKVLVDKLTHQAKELKANNVILNLKKLEVEKKHRFLTKVINSISDGLMVVEKDYSINILNYKISEFVGKHSDELRAGKCYEVYGFSEPCKECPLIDKKITKSVRKVNKKTLTLQFNRFDDYIVESIRDTTREILLLDEIKRQQQDLKEKQHQMMKLNEDLLKMNEKLKKAQEIIDEELRQVGEIQSSLLPEKLPEIEGYEFGAFYTPAEQAGGDYFDCIEMSNGYWGFTVADVSGHGIPAAVIMAITRAIMRSYTYDVISAAEALNMVNEILCDNIYTNDFVTMFYLVMNSLTGECNYASAGHNPLLYFDKSEMVVKKVTANGLFLGTFDMVEYEEGSFTFDNGDIAFMYTDGLVEAMNKNDEQYGYDRLINKIIMFHNEKCDDIIKYIMEDVKEFTEGRPFEDDITIFIIKKKEV